MVVCKRVKYLQYNDKCHQRRFVGKITGGAHSYSQKIRDVINTIFISDIV